MVKTLPANTQCTKSWCLLILFFFLAEVLLLEVAGAPSSVALGARVTDQRDSLASERLRWNRWLWLARNLLLLSQRNIVLTSDFL